MATYGDKPFGLKEIELYSITGATKVQLPAAQELTYEERIVTSELKGDDQLVSAQSISEAVEWSMQSGGIPIDAYALMTGRTVTTSGTTPVASSYLDIDAGRCYPYFQIRGKSISDDCASDFHIRFRKAKLTAIEGALKGGEYWMTKCEGLAISDGVAIASFIQNETATALPAAS